MEYKITRTSTDDSLMHYGIIGMKWGVRRYQNPDGTLTEAGKRRTRKNVKKSRIKAYKDRLNLSDKDLDDVLKRMRKEKEFKQLMEDGESFTKRNSKKLAGLAVGAAITTIGTAAGTGVGKKVIEAGKIVGDNILKTIMNVTLDWFE